jgi:predicted esterase YcpF (UPF0227 family)
MIDTSRLIYLHGSESDSNSGKARQLREWSPGCSRPISPAHSMNAWISSTISLQAKGTGR